MSRNSYPFLLYRTGSPPAPVTPAGFKSFLAFWMGGAEAVVTLVTTNLSFALTESGSDTATINLKLAGPELGDYRARAKGAHWLPSSTGNR